MDPVEALNRIFPDAESFNAKINEAKKYADDCKLTLEYQLAHRPDISAERADAVAAPGELAKLVTDTHKIQNLGQETLEKVRSVTDEIKRLDYTKENLTATMRMLRQLKMLTKLYMQLDSLLKERRYEDMAGNVRAASDLINYFRPFRPLPQISQISHEISEMESKMYEQIEGDFKATLRAENGGGANVNNGPNDTKGFTPLPVDSLRAACHVLDSLDTANGQPIRQNKLIKWYCEEMLSEYQSIFSPEDEAGSLENIKRRFTYLKNKVLLRYMGFHTNLFPESWPVRSKLLKSACDITAKDILAQIHKLRSSESDHIQLLLSTIHESIEFEKFAKCPDEISSQLIPHLSLWIDFQDRQLHSRVSTYARMLLPPDEGDEVIPSSKELINVYRALLAQLSKLKHQESTILQLAEIMAKYLGLYAQQVLTGYLPPALRSHGDVFVAGRVDSTAEYIISTTLQLEKNVNAQLSSSSDDVDATFEKLALGRYRKVSLKVEDLMTQYINRVFEPMWVEYASQYSAHHGRAIDVSRVSPYTARVVSTIDNTLSEVFHAAPTPSMVYGVGTRVVDLVCVGFLTMAMARVVKPLSESQVEQMLLDLGAIKSQSLLHMLDRAPSDINEKKGATRLGRLTQRMLDGMAQAEAVLKVLMTPSEPMETFVRNYQVLIKDRATLNFRKILDVKGIRYQPRAIEKFKLMASQEPQLIPENPLLRQIPTIPPSHSPQMYENGFSNGHNLTTSPGGNGAFGINNFKRIGDFLRRDHQ